MADNILTVRKIGSTQVLKESIFHIIFSVFHKSGFLQWWAGYVFNDDCEILTLISHLTPHTSHSRQVPAAPQLDWRMVRVRRPRDHQSVGQQREHSAQGEMCEETQSYQQSLHFPEQRR